MIRFHNHFGRAAAVALAALGALQLDAVAAEAQARRRPVPAERPSARNSERSGSRAAAPTQALRVRSESLRRGGYAVVIDLDANRLHFVKGRQVLWSALVGTGTGLRLESGNGDWDFDTPDGTFHVIYKEREPDWIAPDWYFVENKLPVPPRNSPQRRFARGLGAAAVYIGQGLAIHGTDKPELLGYRVSHGCIRLSNADALRLFHNVQVGTEVVIVGGDNPVETGPPPRVRSTSRVNERGERIPPPRDPVVVELEGEETEVLLEKLDAELFGNAFAGGSAGPDWPRVASVLLLRGAKGDDDEALAGLLARIDRVGDGRLRQEYATFLADAYTQGTLRTLEVMARLDRQTRARVARAIVDASLGLYPRPAADDASTPWPTKRAPRDVLGRTSQRAWDALQLAERDFRDERGLAVRGRDES